MTALHPPDSIWEVMVATRITTRDVERFTEGDCHVLARALHVATGWPIQALDVDGRGCPDMHAFVLRPDGQALDVQGVHPLEDLVTAWHARATVPTTWKRLREEWGTSVFGDYSFTRARAIAPLLTALP